MKKAKHILMMAALLMQAIPCVYALDGHIAHDPAEAGINATHSCACHSCAGDVCCDDIDVPQELSAPSVAIHAPTFSVVLFVFSETKLSPQSIPSDPVGILSFIRTVQLLI